MTTLKKTPQHRGQNARNAGLSLYPWEVEEITRFANLHAGGDKSALLRRAFAAIGCPLDPDLTAEMPAGPLVGLARRYAPAHVAAVETAFTTSDQAGTIARWIGECAEVIALGAPVDAIHLASEHEISAATVPLHARRYIPRLPRARWVKDSAMVYPEPQPRDLSLNEPPAADTTPTQPPRK